MAKRVVLFANTDWYLFNFRLSLAQALRAAGKEVILVSPPGAYGPKLRELGFEWIGFGFSRNGINPLAELKTVFQLYMFYRTCKPDFVHHFTIKCVIYGGLAARAANVGKIIAAVTGLGHVFTTESRKNALLRPLVRQLYRFTLGSSQVIFQNPDDIGQFLEAGLVSKDRAYLIRGSGVDVAKFTPTLRKMRVPFDRLCVLLVARLLREKGVAEFIEASKIIHEASKSVHRRGVNMEFVIAGDIDDGNPSSFTSIEVADWAKLPNVRIAGHVSDMAALYAQADIVVLPSYREGTPRSLLEAAACGLPLVASDVAGCKEICRHGMNGLLVPARDPRKLAEAIQHLAGDPDKRRSFGAYSRHLAESEFSEAKVLRETLALYQ